MRGNDTREAVRRVCGSLHRGGNTVDGASELDTNDQRYRKLVGVTGLIFVEGFNGNVSRFASGIACDERAGQTVNLDDTRCFSHRKVLPYSLTIAILRPSIFKLVTNASLIASSGYLCVMSFSIGRPMPFALLRKSKVVA